MNTDYYKTLGVSRDASADDIKKAYKKMAMKYHPDRNKGDELAEKKFKEINEAYQVLGDTQKKKNYDQFGSADFSASGAQSSGNPFGKSQYSYYGGGSGFDFSDIFSQFSQGGKNSAQSSFGGGFEDIFSSMGGGNTSRSNSQKTASQQEENLDVVETVEIPFLDFLFDNNISVRTVYGKHLTLKVKAFTKPGTKFRISGK